MARIEFEAASIIPLTNEARQSLLLTLEEQDCAFTVWWAPLSQLWYLTLSVGGTRVAGGRQISANARLIRDHAFAGDLIVVPPAEAVDEAAPGRNAWTEGWRLAYLTPAQVATADAVDRWL